MKRIFFYLILGSILVPIQGLTQVPEGCEGIISIDLDNTPIKYVKLVAHIYFPKSFQCDPEKQQLIEELHAWMKKDVMDQTNYYFQNKGGRLCSYNPEASIADTKIRGELLHIYNWYDDALATQTSHRDICRGCSNRCLDEFVEQADIALKDSVGSFDAINIHFPYTYSNANGWGRASGLGNSRSFIAPDLINYYENVRGDGENGVAFGRGEKAFALGILMSHELGHNLNLSHTTNLNSIFTDSCQDYFNRCIDCSSNNNVMAYGNQESFTIGQAQIMHEFLESNPTLYHE